MSRFLKKLDEEFAAGIDGVTDPATVADLADRRPGEIQGVSASGQESLQFKHTELAVRGPDRGPDGLGAELGCEAGAVVVRDGKVTGRFGYISLNRDGRAGRREGHQAEMSSPGRPISGEGFRHRSMGESSDRRYFE